MFNFKNLVASRLTASVGNGIASDPENVKRARRNFAFIGRYEGDTERGYIDRALDQAIRGFQRDEGLKTDGIMNPGGETERALHRYIEEKRAGGAEADKRPRPLSSWPVVSAITRKTALRM